MKDFSRRNFLATSAVLTAGFAVSACSTTTTTTTGAQTPQLGGLRPFGPEPVFSDYASMYAGLTDGGFSLPAIPYQKVPEQFLRQIVRDPTGAKRGTIVVDTSSHFLYLVLGNGNAVRYGVGLGRAGFEWAGTGEIHSKQEWPKWFPPDEMVDRDPKLEKYRVSYDKKNDVYNGGMEPGPMNPLGARALYIYRDGKDTQYRLHGSPEWSSIGKSVSSGCVRLMNQDIIDLYTRVPIGTEIIVR